MCSPITTASTPKECSAHGTSSDNSFLGKIKHIENKYFSLNAKLKNGLLKKKQKSHLCTIFVIYTPGNTEN